MMFKQNESMEAAEAGLEEVLRNFRSSVHAWSEAEFVRARNVPFAAPGRTWRKAAAWALGCVLAAGSVSAALYEHQDRDQLARLTAERIAAQRASLERQFAAQQAAAQARLEDEKLMAAVDKDVSQEVPSAMEPLAQLMDEGGN